MQGWDLSLWCQALLNLYAGHHLLDAHAFNSSPDTLQSPWTGSLQVFLTSTPSMTCLSETASTGSSHSLVTVVTHLFRTLAITHSQLQTGKCPTNFWHMENMVCHVISAGGSGIAVPRFQCKMWRSPQTLRPNTLALCFKRSGSLQIRPKDYNFVLTSSADTMSSFTYVINVGWCCHHHLFLLCQHCIDDGLHDHQCHILPEVQPCEAISFPFD